MITQGYLSRHFQGRSGMADAALLDVAQDYALKHLHDHGVFSLGIALKGGTALRKFRAGNAGRFSTDLDFAAPDADSAGRFTTDMSSAFLRFQLLRSKRRSPKSSRRGVVVASCVTSMTSTSLARERSTRP